MNKVNSCRRMCALIVTIFCAGNIWAAVEAIDGGFFDPPLVPTTNTAHTYSGNLANRVIADDAVLTGLQINGLLYNVEGPTNAFASDGVTYSPFLGVHPSSPAAAITNLTLSLVANSATCKVVFASMVTRDMNGGFFAAEMGSSDSVTVYPLGSDGERIGSWQLYISNNDYGGDNLLYPHGRYYSGKSSSGATSPSTEQTLGGAAFTLSDFTGGSGELNNVQGLEFVDEDGSVSFDLAMAGIYTGPGVSVFGSAGRPGRLTGAVFNPSQSSGGSVRISNDFSVVSFDGAESLAGPSDVYSFDGRSVSYVMYPTNGTMPSSVAEALLGLDINGVKAISYWDFLFADAVTNSVDGFFIIEAGNDYSGWDNVFVYPLDENRRPISSYSVASSWHSSEWADPALLNSAKIVWGGNADAAEALFAGLMMPLSAFAGGTGGLTEVHGIRIVCPWNLDPLVVGSYTASIDPRPVVRAEYDPAPTPYRDSALTGTYQHDYTLQAISIDGSRYTDLEGPTNVILTGGGRLWPIGGTQPSSKEDAVLGLNGASCNNASVGDYIFETTVTNGFDGGFFIFEFGGNDDVRVVPLDANGDLIPGYGLYLDDNLDFNQRLLNQNNIVWRYTTGGTSAYNTHLYAASFRLATFTNGVGESLTGDVKGVRLIDDIGGATFDTIMVGVYQGPSESPVCGSPSPVTEVTFTPPLETNTNRYSNDVSVAKVECADSTSYSVRSPDMVSVFAHINGDTYFPINGVDPGEKTIGYTNALLDLNINGVVNTYFTEYMFDKPVKNLDEGFFIIELGGNDFSVWVRPLGADRYPISTYSVLLEPPVWGAVGDGNFIMDYNGGVTVWAMKGVMMELADFAGGTGDLGSVYGIRIEHFAHDFDPAVVGQWFRPLKGTVLLVY